MMKTGRLFGAALPFQVRRCAAASFLGCSSNVRPSIHPLSDGFSPRGIYLFHFHVATEPFHDADMKYPGFVVVFVLGAVACHGDRSYSAGPSYLVQDGPRRWQCVFLLAPAGREPAAGSRAGVLPA